MAFETSAATTLESTPPESPRITRLSPTCSRMAAIESSMIESIVQLFARPQMSKRKLASIWLPCGVWRTSGWNCVAYSPRSASSMDATGQMSVCEVMTKPSGTSVTASRWLIHTVCSCGVSASSRESEPARVILAGPYSPLSVCPTAPPSATAMACCP